MAAVPFTLPAERKQLVAGSESHILSLLIRRRDRTEAQELASMTEYARAQRLLAYPDRM